MLWSGELGGTLTARNFRRAVDWEKIKTALRRPDLRVHDLWHTLAAILFDARASAPCHSTLQNTERYSRARKGVAKRAGFMLDGLVDPDEPKSKKNRKTPSAKKPGRTVNTYDPFSIAGRGNGARMAQGHGPRGL